VIRASHRSSLVVEERRQQAGEGSHQEHSVDGPPVIQLFGGILLDGRVEQRAEVANLHHNAEIGW